jgi:hypothetical protein
MSASARRQGEALFLDMRCLEAESSPLPSSLELIVIDLGIRHINAGAGYRERRAECRRRDLFGPGSLSHHDLQPYAAQLGGRVCERAPV